MHIGDNLIINIIMKIDFRTIQVKDIEGNIVPFDISKVLGNTIYQKTTDLGELELAQQIYKNGEVELSTEQAERIKEYVKNYFAAIAQVAVNEALSTK
jgi:hypothetical protein